MSNYLGKNGEENRPNYVKGLLLVIVIGIFALVWWVNKSGAGGPPQRTTASSVNTRKFRAHR